MISLCHEFRDVFTVFTGPWACSVSLFVRDVATIRHPSLFSSLSMDIVFLICDTV